MPNIDKLSFAFSEYKNNVASKQMGSQATLKSVTWFYTARKSEAGPSQAQKKP